MHGRFRGTRVAGARLPQDCIRIPRRTFERGGPEEQQAEDGFLPVDDQGVRMIIRRLVDPDDDDDENDPNGGDDGSSRQQLSIGAWTRVNKDFLALGTAAEQVLFWQAMVEQEVLNTEGRPRVRCTWGCGSGMASGRRGGAAQPAVRGGQRAAPLVARRRREAEEMPRRREGGPAGGGAGGGGLGGPCWCCFGSGGCDEPFGGSLGCRAL